LYNGGGSRGGGPGQGVWGTEVPQWDPEQSPGRESGGQSPPEAKAKCEISIQFVIFLCKISDLMNIRAGLGEYILQTHNIIFLKIQSGG